jgi:hypothetical protein
MGVDVSLRVTPFGTPPGWQIGSRSGQDIDAWEQRRPG